MPTRSDASSPSNSSKSRSDSGVVAELFFGGLAALDVQMRSEMSLFSVVERLERRLVAVEAGFRRIMATVFSRLDKGGICGKRYDLGSLVFYLST